MKQNSRIIPLKKKALPRFSPSGARVPPAWTDVWMTGDPHSPLQVTGRDKKGRRVYLYSAEHMGLATAAKFSRLKDFAKSYRGLMRKIRRDMNTSEEALVLYLIARTGFRIGSEDETQAEVKAFGASTLLCAHVNIEGNKLSFDFTGKKGIRVNKAITDKDLAWAISFRCKGRADRKIFHTSDDKIRHYLDSISNGKGFTVKDFRTYLGTLTAFRKINRMAAPENGTQFKRYRNEVGKTVALELGNSRAIALKSYVAPEVFCNWEAGLGAVNSEKRTTLKQALLDCVKYDRVVKGKEYPDPDPLEKES